jgi:hypothetical protein
MGDKKTEGKEQVRNRRGGGGEAEISVRSTAPMFISANYNRKKILLVSATLLKAVSIFQAVSSTANCSVGTSWRGSLYRLVLETKRCVHCSGEGQGALTVQMCPFSFTLVRTITEKTKVTVLRATLKQHSPTSET